MRRLTVFGICLCGGFVGGLLAGSAMWYFSDATSLAPHSDQASGATSAHELRLVDEQGKVRALLTFSAHAKPYVEILDEHDTPNWARPCAKIRPGDPHWRRKESGCLR